MDERVTRRRNVTLIVVPVTILIIFSAIAPNIPALYGMRGDYRAVVAFNRYLDSGRYGDAFMLIAPEMQARTDYPAFASRADAVRDRMGHLKSFKVTRLSSHGSKIRRISTLDATIVYERGSLSLEYTLLSDHRKWYVWDYAQR